MTLKMLFPVGFGFALFWIQCGSQSPQGPTENVKPWDAKLKPHLAEAFKWSFPETHWDPKSAQEALDALYRWRKGLASQDMRRMNQGEWRLEGPTNIGGRLNFLRPTPGLSGNWWAGSASGGLWHTEDFGETWNWANEDMPHLACGDLAFHPTNAMVLWLATGDPQISSFPRLGGGVFKSVDGGQTWLPDGLDSLGIVSRLVTLPIDGEPWLFAGTMGNPAIPGSNRGLFCRPLQGEASDWTQVLLPSDSAGVTDVVGIETTNLGGVILAAAWQRTRTSTHSVVTGGDCRIHRSLDGGETWSVLPNPWGEGARGRIGFTVHEETVWALVVGENHQLDNIYKTEDGGETWNAVIPEGAAPENALGGFGWYFSKIRVNPFNPNDLTILGVELHNSLDGGLTWNLMNPDWWTYEVHADKHDLDWINANEAIIATDGGAYRTTNHGDTWEDIESLPNSQFYRVTWNPHNPGKYTAGAQDNGTTTGSFEAMDEWTRDLGGDGFTAAFHPTNEALRYAEYQYGNMRFSPTLADEEPQWQSWMNGIPDDARVWWDAPYMLHPANPDQAWCGAQQAYKMQDAPYGIWSPASSDLTANMEPGLQWRTITALAGSPIDEDVVAAGTSDGRVWWTANGGAFWQELSEGLPGQFVTDLVFHPQFPDTLICTVSGYRNAAYTPHIFKRSLNAGNAGWISAAGNLPHHPINHVEVLRDSVWAVASDAGVYWTTNSGTHWEPVGNLPPIPVYDLAVDTLNDRLVAGTFAQSVWSFPLDSLLPEEAFNPPNDVTALTSERAEWRVIPNPASKSIRLQGPDGKNPRSIDVRNARGQLIHHVSVGDGAPLLQVEDWSPGIYIITCYSSEAPPASIRFVKN